MPNEPSAKKEMPSSAKEAPMPSTAKLEVKVPDAPPVVSSLKKPAEVSASSVQPHVEEDEVVILKETVSKKFGEMTFSDYNSVEDGDYSLSEAETEDSLEWASETERTRVEEPCTFEELDLSDYDSDMDADYS